MDKNWNLQWIFVIFVISHCVVICQKLTENENLIRLRDCGKQFLPQPSRNETGVEFNYFNGTTEEAGFLLWISQINSNTTLRFNQSTAFPISDRHVLTSSQVVMTGTQHWSLDGLHFKDSEYYANDNKENCFATVPPHIAKNLIIHGKGKTFKVLRSVATGSRPVTGNRPIGLNIPCLLEAKPLDEEINRKVVDSSDFDAYGLDGTSIKHHRVKYDGIQKEYTKYRYMKIIPFYQSSNDRGGPLVMNLDGKATVAGLKASSTDIYNGRIYFNFIPMLEDRICEHSGVCFVKNVTEALEKISTTEAPVTKAPEDGGLSEVTPSGSENSGTPRQPSPDADDAVEPKRPTYSEEVEPEESESGEDEEDTDILLDKDFNRGTRLSSESWANLNGPTQTKIGCFDFNPPCVGTNGADNGGVCLVGPKNKISQADTKEGKPGSACPGETRTDGLCVTQVEHVEQVEEVKKAPKSVEAKMDGANDTPWESNSYLVSLYTAFSCAAIMAYAS